MLKIVGYRKVDILRLLTVAPTRQTGLCCFKKRSQDHYRFCTGRLVVRQIPKYMSAPSSTVASTAQSGDASVSDGPSVSGQDQDVIVQYIVLRSDLWKNLGWPLGSIVAQACHAATAALWLHQDQPHSQTYCSDGNLDHMHKVVLEVKGDAQLTNLAAKLQEAGVPHKLWVEQPENFVTCLATAPCPKSFIQQHFKKLKLCKGT